MSRPRKHRHFQYTFNFNTELISQLSTPKELCLLEEMWRKTFCVPKKRVVKDAFWTSLVNYAFI
ncbi:MAG: hypothetical protein GX050_09795 [Firmicutes bacterium]|nr:hypothetical protein [Bacillota bacterium]